MPKAIATIIVSEDTARDKRLLKVLRSQAEPSIKIYDPAAFEMLDRSPNAHRYVLIGLSPYIDGLEQRLIALGYHVERYDAPPETLAAYKPKGRLPWEDPGQQMPADALIAPRTETGGAGIAPTPPPAPKNAPKPKAAARSVSLGPTEAQEPEARPDKPGATDG